MEKDKEPGSARLGNFINYYAFNPPERRLQLVPKTMLRDWCDSANTSVTALDIGSNAGSLTLALYTHLTDAECCGNKTDVQFLGVDVDPVLVERSIQSNNCQNNITFRVADILSDDDRRLVIGEFLREKRRDRFDIVFSCSVTMWIHLNHGDQGLRSFLRYVASIADLLLIEPQPWHCYQTAARRMRKLGCAPFEHLPTLQWRENVVHEIVGYLESDDCSMKRIENFGNTESWERPLCLFRSSRRPGPVCDVCL